MAANIAIIGGGFSGLVSAYLLERLWPAGGEILIFEATNRIGGRIRTGQFENNYESYDAGCAELYDITGAPYLRELVDDLVLPTIPMSATPYFLCDGKTLRNERDFHQVFGKHTVQELNRFWDLGTSLRSQSEYAQAGHPRDNQHPWINRTFEDVLWNISDPAARQFTKFQVHSDVATEPHLTSGLFGFDNLLIDNPDYCSMYRIPGGNQRLVDRLAEEISATVLLSTPVLSVEALSVGKYKIEFRQGKHRRNCVADIVLVAPPPLQLKRINWSGMGLSRAVDSHVRHHSPCADYLRVTLLFRERFWTEALPEPYFVADVFDGVTIYDQSTTGGAGLNHGILSWLLAGAAASKLASAGDDEILGAVLSLLPTPLSQGKELVLDHRVDRWTEEWGVSRLPGGYPLQSFDRRHHPQPDLDGLLFVGDYLYDSTLSGAFDSACHAMQRILALCAPSNDWTVEEIRRCVQSGRRPAEIARRSSLTSTLPFINA